MKTGEIQQSKLKVMASKKYVVNMHLVDGKIVEKTIKLMR